MLTYPEIDPIAIAIGPLTVAGKTIGPLEIHWYGLMYLFGFAGAWMVALYRSRRTDLVVDAKEVEDLIFYGAMGVVIGARVGYVFFYQFSALLDDPMMLLRVWDGGMSFHGGFLGVITAMLWYSRKIRKNFFDVMDFLAPFVPIGLGLGRLGNFIGAELYGRVTDAPWGMVFPSDPEGLIRHPSQLYQMTTEGILLFAILFWFSRKPRPRAAVCSLFVLLYGVARFGVEFVRQPDAHIMFDAFGWLTRGQLLCIPMVLVGGGVFVYAYVSQKKTKQAA